MEADLELDSWRRHWRQEEVALPDLKDLVERQTRTMRLWVVGEIIVTILFGGGSLALAALNRRTDFFVLAAGIWVFIAIAWAISYLLRRGAWAPMTATTSAFLDLMMLRCRRRRESIAAQCLLYTMILTFDLVWIYFARESRAADGVLAFLTSSGVAWVWIVTVALGVVAVWQRRKLGRELEVLTSLRSQID
jgi:hypothetical protein